MKNSPPTPPQADQKTSVADEHIDPDDVVIQRVAGGLLKADRMLQAERRKKIWLVVCYEEVGKPEIHELQNMEDLKEQLKVLQNWQYNSVNGEAGQSLFYYIFSGERWATQQIGGKLIGVYDHNEVHPLNVDSAEEPPNISYEGKVVALADVPDENTVVEANNAEESDDVEDVGDPQTI